MPRWLWLIAISSLLYCGCVGPRSIGSLWRDDDGTAKRAAAVGTDSFHADTAAQGPPPVSQSSLLHEHAVQRPPVIQGPATQTPIALNTQVPVHAGEPTSVSALTEIERTIASDPSKMNPQMQHYLREQVLAILASQNATRPGHESAETVRPQAPIQSAPAIPQAALPGPDSTAGAPIIDEATYRESRLSKGARRTQVESSPQQVDEIQPAAHVESESNRVVDRNKDERNRESGQQKKRVDSTNETAAGATQVADWRESLEQTLQLLQAELKNLPEKDKDAATFAIYERLMQAIANNHEEAVTAIEQLPKDDQEYWKHQLYALTLAIDADGKHTSSRRAALALRELRDAVDRLANVSTLDVRHLAFCKSVESYGCYTEFPTQSFKAGDEVVLYVEVDNFTAEKVQDKYETELLWTYDIYDDHGKRVTNVVLPPDKNRCDNRRRDYFIAPEFSLPNELRAGSYKLRLTVEDVKGGKSNEGTLEFKIR